MRWIALSVRAAPGRCGVARRIGIALRLATALVAVVGGGAPAWAADFVVLNTGDSGADTLRAAIDNANAAGAGVHTITFASSLAGQTITLSSSLPILDNSAAAITIDGATAAGLTVSGNSTSQVFFVASGDVRIANLTVSDALAKGGNGGGPEDDGGGGGGGLGAGGGLFVNTGAVVTVENVTFADNAARGGDGGTSSGGAALFDAGGGGGGFRGNGGRGGYEGGGGGGGFGGNGGNVSNATSDLAGAEGGGLTANGANASGNTPGSGASPEGGDGGSFGNAGANGAAFGGGGGGGTDGNGPSARHRSNQVMTSRSTWLRGGSTGFMGKIRRYVASVSTFDAG